MEGAADKSYKIDQHHIKDKMDDKLIPAYIASSAALLGIPMDAARLAPVAAHLQRTVAMAALLEDAALDAHDELPEIYSPAALPTSKDGR